MNTTLLGWILVGPVHKFYGSSDRFRGRVSLAQWQKTSYYQWVDNAYPLPAPDGQVPKAGDAAL